MTHPSENVITLVYIQLSETSFDLCDDDPDPFISGNLEDHGTAVAGEIVGARSNGQCGTGIAYNARIGSEFNPNKEVMTTTCVFVNMWSRKYIVFLHTLTQLKVVYYVNCHLCMLLHVLL